VREVENGLIWNAVIDDICPLKAEKVKKPILDTAKDSTTQKWILQRQGIPFSLKQENRAVSFATVDEVVYEDDSSILWPMLLAAFVLFAAMYFIVYFLMNEISHRRRAIFSKQGSFGGHARARGVGGAPHYYKLYEECSIPNEAVPNKNLIYAVLKNTKYDVMKDNSEVVV